MSLQLKFKDEILDNTIVNNKIAKFFDGFLNYSNSIRNVYGRNKIEIELTEFSWATKILNMLAKVNINANISIVYDSIVKKTFKIKPKYEEIIALIDSDDAIMDCGSIDGFDSLKAYICGAFFAVGKLSAPNALEDIGDNEEFVVKDNKKYYIEFSFDTEERANFIVETLRMLDLKCKKFYYEKNYRIRINEYSYIEDFLVIAEANNTLIEFDKIVNVRAENNFKNRIMNCSIGNVNKSIEASVKQTKAIKKIIKLKSIEFLSEKLQEIALLRLKNPTSSLDELVLISGNITKSGVNHRLRKIVEIADSLIEY